AQSNGLGQAIRNANDGIGLIQTADGALEEYGDILNRIRTLAVQGANDTQDTASRTFIGKEMLRLQSELSHIAAETKFNGKQLLAATTTFVFQVGAYKGETTNTIISAATVAAAISAGGVIATTADVDTQSEMASMIAYMDNSIKYIDTIRANLTLQNTIY
ncbi:MAG: flagellin, partial [Campylobacterota bacterium]|nr:flagellin [Campylobacterota bacterium]